MRVITFVIHLSLLLSSCNQARADIWDQITGAGFSFAQADDPGPRETKRIVYDYIKLSGVPLDGSKFGLFLTAGQSQMLDTASENLQAHLEGYTPPAWMGSVLTDNFARKDITATTENDYTHALHGMFMLVINTILADPFVEDIDRYRVQLDVEGEPLLGAQRSVRSTPKRHFFPDWLVSFPATEGRKVLEAKQVLSAVEFKLGGKDFAAACALLDKFFASGGGVAAIWSPDTTVKEGVIHYVPVKNGRLFKFEVPKDDANKYDLLFDRVLEAAATAFWADTKVTIFAANSQYFAAGPARGYGLREELLEADQPLSVDKRADVIDDDMASKAKVAKIKKARHASRKNNVNEPFVASVLTNDVPVNSKVIYIPSYGTAKKPATLLVHVLALTFDKLQNGFAESKVKLDHSASAGGAPATPVAGKHPLEDASTTDRSNKKPALEGSVPAVE